LANQQSPLRFSLVLALGLSLVALACLPARAADRRLRVLFLGDRGHHQPRARAEQIIPVLDRVGIDVVYTEDITALTVENLRKFDSLLVYANIDRLEDQPA
jgi:uncharacterized protein